MSHSMDLSTDQIISFKLWLGPRIKILNRRGHTAVTYIRVVEPMDQSGKASSKRHTERFRWNAMLGAVSNFYFFCPTSASLCCEEYVYIHIFDCVEIAYELPLLPNNTASEIFLHKSGAMRSVEWTPVWRWQGEYFILNKTYYNRRFKQEVVAPVLITFSSLTQFSKRPIIEI